MRFAIVHEKIVNSIIIHVPLCRSTKPTKHKNVTLIECETMGQATVEASRVSTSHAAKEPLVCRCVSGYLESLK